MLLNHANYPCLFKLDIVGDDGINTFDAEGHTVPTQKGTTYTSDNSNIDDTEIAKYGSGSVVGWYSGGSYVSLSVLGDYYISSTEYDIHKYEMLISHYGTNAAATPNSSTQLCMMLPMTYVERVYFS